MKIVNVSDTQREVRKSIPTVSTEKWLIKIQVIVEIIWFFIIIIIPLGK